MFVVSLMGIEWVFIDLEEIYTTASPSLSDVDDYCYSSSAEWTRHDVTFPHKTRELAGFPAYDWQSCQKCMQARINVKKGCCLEQMIHLRIGYADIATPSGWYSPHYKALVLECGYFLSLLPGQLIKYSVAQVS